MRDVFCSSPYEMYAVGWGMFVYGRLSNHSFYDEICTVLNWFGLLCKIWHRVVGFFYWQLIWLYLMLFQTECGGLCCDEYSSTLFLDSYVGYNTSYACCLLRFISMLCLDISSVFKFRGNRYLIASDILKCVKVPESPLTDETKRSSILKS